jgi:hypothetical protein
MICFYGSFHVKRHNKIVILTLIICINITIPLNIFSKVKNSNYNENDLICEITETYLI